MITEKRAKKPTAQMFFVVINCGKTNKRNKCMKATNLKVHTAFEFELDELDFEFETDDATEM